MSPCKTLWKRSGVWAIALAMALGATRTLVAEASDQRGFLHNGVTAHRGNSSEFAENTLPAIRSAMELGVDWVEIDVHRTRDGKLVVIHDGTTNRVGDKSLVVAEATCEELRKVDVATEFRRRQGKSLDTCPPQHVPLLEEIIEIIQQQQRTRLSIQPKVDCVAEVAAFVRRLGAERWVGFNDGNLDYMTEARRLLPKSPIFWDRGESDIAADIRTAKEHGFTSLVLHHNAVTRDKVEQIKKAELEPGAWTVNDRDLMTRLLDLGIQRLYTDDPRRLLAVQAARRFGPVVCEGTYPRHLQGICTDERETIYWSFTDVLVKTDLAGKVLKKVPVANHHGDLCLRDGRVYVAVNLGRFNRPPGEADSWVYVYDADTLAEIAKHPVPELVHGAGGMAEHDGRFIVVGGLPQGTEENYLYEYDASFTFRKRHVLPSGWTDMGIQTATFAEGFWWFGCYGTPRVLLKADTSLKLMNRHEFECSLGVAGLPDGRFLIGRGTSSRETGCGGRILLARMSEKSGLVVDPAASSPASAGR